MGIQLSYCNGADPIRADMVARPREGEGADDDAYRINSYRVLLTRGRDGFIVFIPEEEELDAVAKVFSEIGIEEL